MILKKIKTFKAHGFTSPAILFMGVTCASIAQFLMQQILARRGWNPFYDDTYYYIVIAKNWVRHGVFTFDGTSLTNGFHPLWMMILVGLFKTVGANREPAIDISLVLGVQALIRWAAAWAGLVFALNRFRKQDRVEAAGFVACVVLLFSPGTSGLFATGMETTLAVFFLIVSLGFWIERREMALAWSLAALSMARLDLFVFFVLPLLGFIFWGEGRSWRQVGRLFLPTVGVFTGYSWINFSYFGDVRPISGILKSSFPIPLVKLSIFFDPIRVALDPARGPLWLVIPNIITITVALLLSITLLMRKNSPASQTQRRIGFLVCVGLGMVANWVFFQKWNRGIEPWYLGVPSLLACFVFAAGIAKVTSVKSISQRTLLLGLFLVCVVSIGHSIRKVVQNPQNNSAAKSPLIEWMLTRDRGDLFAMTDSGAVAFFSNRSVVNLDGLVNNHSYQDALASTDGLGRYLRDKKVRFLITNVIRPDEGDRIWPYFTWRKERMWQYCDRPDLGGTRPVTYDDFKFYVYSYRYMKFSDPVILSSRQEVFRHSTGNSTTLVFDLSRPY